MMVAVGFSPRGGPGFGARRGATLEMGLAVRRRYATRLPRTASRGLKPTATVVASLREALTELSHVTESISPRFRG